MKKQNGANETDIAAAASDMEPSEFDTMREQLEEERIINEALSRQVIKLKQALDAALSANDERIEGDMISVVNTNAANRKAKDKKAAQTDAKNKAIEKSFLRHCRLNAATLGISITAATATIVAGHFGVIGPELATALSCVSLLVVGWALHDCFLLFKFADTLKG